MFHRCSCDRATKFQVFSSSFVIFSNIIFGATWNVTFSVLTEGRHTLISYLPFGLHKSIKWTSFFEPFDPMVWLMNFLLYCSIIVLFHSSICKLRIVKVCNFSLFQRCLFHQSLILDHFSIVFAVFWCIHFMSFLIYSSSWFLMWIYHDHLFFAFCLVLHAWRKIWAAFCLIFLKSLGFIVLLLFLPLLFHFACMSMLVYVSLCRILCG